MRKHLMRTYSFKATVLALLAIGLTAGVETARAQSEIQLVTPTTGWRYNKSGANLGASSVWAASAYSDTVAGWEGPGTMLFGFETTQAEYLPFTFNTAFPDPATQSPFVTNYYFRTHFTMPNMSPSAL